jgi:PEP-CTERM motif
MQLIQTSQRDIFIKLEKGIQISQASRYQISAIPIHPLYIWNGTSFVFDTILAPDTIFDFQTGGISEFEVLGIAPSLGLDPENPTAFITNLTFEGPGQFPGTMTPITTSVPEPSTWALMLLGFTGIGYAASRKRRTRFGGA